MKCVQNILDGKVTRVSNEIADAMVTRGTHKFVSKSIWKNAREPEAVSTDELRPEISEVPKKKKNKKNKKFKG